MYTPPAFAVSDRQEIFAMAKALPLALFVTATADGPMATPLPVFIDESEGENGTLYAHLARANPQWSVPPVGDALAIFSGPDAYVTPSWYATKREHGRVVPTWNYEAVHLRGPVEFFDDEERLHAVVTRLTDRHEKDRAEPWAVTDAPDAFIAAQLRGIVGLRMPITGLVAKRKMSQNRSAADQEGVRHGLSQSASDKDRVVSGLVGRQA